MTRRLLLDASAILAYLWNEAGSDQVASALVQGAVGCTAANWAEVVTKVLARGADWDLAKTALIGQGIEIIPVQTEEAERAGRLWQTHPSLSLGDRFCLAVAQNLDVPVLTTDRYWAKVTPLAQVIS
ncbi:MAG: type II toxin-antitoxin system VapC family toxin [Micrococcales bacterium]|nr:type II toxin-antitoxin system VapC family toxin [Micrococcales bacterium]